MFSHVFLGSPLRKSDPQHTKQQNTLQQHQQPAPQTQKQKMCVIKCWRGGKFVFVFSFYEIISAEGLSSHLMLSTLSLYFSVYTLTYTSGISQVAFPSSILSTENIFLHRNCYYWYFLPLVLPESAEHGRSCRVS